MALGIGGAETHIVELSKALRRLGHEVCVVSGGGVYVGELEKNGVRHINLPMNSRNPKKVLAAYNGLRKLLKKEHFDVVHAHARIPAFICGIVAKTNRDFRFVTTAHGVYEMNSLASRIGNWGQRSLAVSCDVKEYLINSYKIPSDNIFLTVNGIDTERFSAQADSSEFISEFGLNPGCRHRVVYVSRIDTASAHVAFMLVNSAHEIFEKWNDAEIVIVGGGTAFDRLKEAADKVNGSCARRIITLTGPRTDIDRITASATVFIGVSRALLEAMAEEKPAVIAGSQGYIGILTKDVVNLSVETNFCARGCVLPDEEIVKRDVIDLLGRTPGELSEMGAFNRSVVLDGYSTEQMAKDAVAMYESTPLRRREKGKKVLICGYYGYGNSGDDLLLRIITENLHRQVPGIDISVLTKSPRQTARTCSVRGCRRFNPFSLFAAVMRSNLLISGGGTLLADNTSSRSLFYYTFIIRLARALGKKVMVYGSGVGPVSTQRNRVRVLKALGCCDKITLRESSSLNEIADYINETGYSNDILSKAEVTADPAFLMRLPDPLWQKQIAARLGLINGRNYFAVALRPWKDNAADIEEQTAEAARVLFRRFGLSPVIIAMQASFDLPMAERIAELIPETKPVVVHGLTAPETASIIGMCRFSVGMRLHSIIYSAVAGVPSVCISYDPKVDALAKELELNVISAETLTCEDIVAAAESVLDNRNQLAEKLRGNTRTLREKASSDPESVRTLLKG